MSSLPVLVLNSGSSSIKFSVYEAGDGERTQAPRGRGRRHRHRSRQVLDQGCGGNKLVDQTPALPTRAVAFKLVADALHSGDFPAPVAIGHRMVCGGPTVQENQRITPELIDEMERYTAFAPLHTPIAVYIMREALRLFPGVPNFVILDTYFHRTMPEVSQAHAHSRGVFRDGRAPLRRARHLLRVDRLPVAAPVPEKLIVAHLGNGASISAILQWPVPRYLDGPHAHRRHHQRHPHRRHRSRRAAVHPAQDCRDRRSRRRGSRSVGIVASKKAGLLGVSELSNDMRDLRDAINAGNAKARLAVDKFNWTIVKWIGSFVAELGGLDMLVFTGGIGENDIAARGEICSALGALASSSTRPRTTSAAKPPSPLITRRSQCASFRLPKT
jgi:acetate kinase